VSTSCIMLTNIWRYNPVTGCWRLARDAYRESAKTWLKLLQDDEPGVHFKISDRRPKTPPKELK